MHLLLVFISKTVIGYSKCLLKKKKSDTFSIHGIKKGTAKHQMWCLAALLVINKCQICLFVIYLGACSQLLFSKKYLVNCTKYNQDTHNNRQCHDINLLLFNFESSNRFLSVCDAKLGQESAITKCLLVFV